MAEHGHGRLAYTVAELAAQLRCSRSHVYALVARGELPKARKLGNRTIFIRAEVEKALRRLPQVG